ncbi:MAG: PKD domain-containing protein [Desulfotignum sp.]|nr:PKD domain-containing protein [Desulfotignum sp.]
MVKSQLRSGAEDNNVTVDWFYSPEDLEPFDSGNEINYEVQDEERIYAKVRNAFGCYSINSEYVQILTESPSAEMEVSDSDINFGIPVQFFAREAVNVESYRWDFGDGLYSTRKNPYHYYYEADTFNVSLQMVSANGCTITMTENDMVIVRSEANSVDEGIILSGKQKKRLEMGNMRIKF